jgi:hypothetical protein
MKYMMLVYAVDGDWPEDELQKARDESVKLCHELASQGRYLSASPLHPVATATCVRVRGGKRLTTDGPFAETIEQLGGYFLIEAANRDEAIAIAWRIPGARRGTVEVRPVAELAGLLEVKS